jgi:hypothetical protein
MSAIEAAAYTVATAKQSAATADTAAPEAREAADLPKRRIAALQAERAHLVTTARGGDADGKIALRLAIIDADLADLAPLAAEADADLGKAKTAAASAAAAVASAEQQLAMASDAALEADLTVHATHLAELLGETVAEMRAIWQRRGARPSWFPPSPVVDELVRLQLAGKQMGVRPMTATTIAGRHRHAFSVRTRRRVLSAIRKRALDGDLEAAELLLRLGEQVAGDRATTLPPGTLEP